MTSKLGRILLVVLATLIGSYWYWSPFWALHTMKVAAQESDADRFNRKVDYPRLRESLKGQLSAMMTKQLLPPMVNANSKVTGWEAMGTMLGLALVSNIVDSMVRPELVMQAMREGKWKQKPKPADGDEAGPTPNAVEAGWSIERKGFDVVIVHIEAAGEPADKRIGVVMERSGFADWKLTEVRMPALMP